MSDIFYTGKTFEGNLGLKRLEEILDTAYDNNDQVLFTCCNFIDLPADYEWAKKNKLRRDFLDMWNSPMSW